MHLSPIQTTALGTTQQQITFPTGLTILNDKSLISENLVAKNNVHVANTIASINVLGKNVRSPKSRAVEVKTRRIGAGGSGKIRIQGTLRVSGAVVYTPPTIDLAASPFAEKTTPTNFLEVGDRPHQPWRRISFDTFDGDSNDWQITNNGSSPDRASPTTSLSHCGDHNTFLGGHCKVGGAHVLQKQFQLSSVAHNEVRVVAKVHMIDSWENEIAWMSIDDHIVWTTTASAAGAATRSGNVISLCGNPSHSEASLGVVVDITVPHTKENVKIRFGTTLDEHECNESLGLDDVHLYVH